MEGGPLITLTTDFGAGSCFVGVMKGVIRSLNPQVEVVDLTHTVGFGNVKEAAFIISKCYRFFPDRSVHLVVVDPGVGTSRRAMALEKGRTVFVAPDNGVLSYVYEPERDRLYHLDDDTFFLKPVSRTFHGRDVFAPVAALVAAGVSLTTLGTRCHDPVLIPPPEVKVTGEMVEGEVLFADSFGNLITAVDEGLIAGRRIRGMWLGDREVYGPVSSFEEGRGKGLCAIVDSFGHLEVFVYMGSALEASGWSGEPLRVLFD